MRWQCTALGLAVAASLLVTCTGCGSPTASPASGELAAVSKPPARQTSDGALTISASSTSDPASSTSDAASDQSAAQLAGVAGQATTTAGGVPRTSTTTSGSLMKTSGSLMKAGVTPEVAPGSTGSAVKVAGKPADQQVAAVTTSAARTSPAGKTAAAKTPAGKTAAAKTPAGKTAAAKTAAAKTAAAKTAKAAAVARAGAAAAANSGLTLGPGTESAVEAQVVTLVNQQRLAAGCQAVTVSPILITVARAHSKEMSGSTGGIKHNSANGRTPFQRMTAAGYEYSVAAENIAAGQPTATAVMAAWMASQGHRANILNCGLTQIGVGMAYKAGSQYGTYWTQDLGTPM
jgi:uncharacterized protein YkwD